MVERKRKTVTPVQPPPYLCGPDGTPLTSEGFSVEEYLSGVLPGILDTAEGRSAATKYDPLLFALTYCPNAMRSPDTGHLLTLSDLHLDLCRSALSWASPAAVAKANRTAYIAPRESGKSTWVYKLLPLWAAAHGHRTFVAAFADSATQAREHLANFRTELEQNKVLRADFIDLCTPARRASGGNVKSDSQDDYQARSGFVFKARGIDSSILGMKVGDKRPDLIIMDDLEKGESNYSVEQAEKRLETVHSTVLPLSMTAVVVLTGTVNMVGSIMDQLARSADGDDIEWVAAMNFRTRYFPALVKGDDGSERSMWPGKWTVEWLLEEQKTDPRGFAKNFMNQPMGADGGYWERDYFQYGKLPAASFTILSIDPAVSSKSTSDWTGIAVISYSRALDKFSVKYADQVRMGGAGLRARAMSLLDRFPEITNILIETNQGGDLWTQQDGVFHGIPDVRTLVKHQKLSKELRAEKAVLEFTKGRVLFEDRFPELERQLLAFPKVIHDDMVDAVTTGVNEIRDRVTRDRSKPRSLIAGRMHYR